MSHAHATHPLPLPGVDPTSIFEHFRGVYGSRLLIVAASHLKLFDRLAAKPMTRAQLAADLGFTDRATVVLTSAVAAMGLIALDATESEPRWQPTPLAVEHLLAGGPFEVSDYLAQHADDPGVLDMLDRLRTSKPAGADSDDGAAWMYKEGEASAMETDLAAQITLILAGRAKNVAPVLAAKLPMRGDETVIDVGGGTGIYAIALLRAHPKLRAIVMDRPNVLKVAAKFAAHYGVADRLEHLPGDMFTDPIPQADAVLLSNVLHDWDTPECNAIVARCAQAVTPGGRLLIHDVFLTDALDGPLPVTLYSAALFCVTDGRAYSEAEYRAMMHSAGLRDEPGRLDTLVHVSASSVL